MKFHVKVIAFVLCVVATSANFGHTKMHKVIIDTDAGGDDAAAILLALGAQKRFVECGFEVIAITCTYGNTDVDNVANNVLKILTIAKRSDIPVYVGARKPLLKARTKDNYFGEDGFGDFHFDEKIVAKLNKSQHASVAMVELVRANPGRVSIIAIGPLTNIALAMTIDSTFVENVERFYLLGSSVRGVGNVAPNVEFNFAQDPHSNAMVLNGMGERPAFLFPWETNLDAGITMDWRMRVLGTLNSRTMEYLNKIENATLHGQMWHPADLGLSAVAIWWELVGSTLFANVTPVTDGIAEGSVLVDYANTTGKPVNAEILEHFDVDSFKRLILEMFAEN